MSTTEQREIIKSLHREAFLHIYSFFREKGLIEFIPDNSLSELFNELWEPMMEGMTTEAFSKTLMEYSVKLNPQN